MSMSPVKLVNRQAELLGPRLAMLRRGMRISDHPVTGDPLTIGRGDDNRIVLDDGMASKNHARVTLREGHADLEDLESLNGTRLNEARVAEASLHPGDVVRIGRTLFIYLVDHMPLQRSTVGAIGWLIGRRPGGGGVKAAVTRLPILLGAADQAEVRVKDEDTPHFQFQIVAGSSGAQLLDLTEPLPRLTMLGDGDQLKFEHLSLRFRSAESDSDAASSPATVQQAPHSFAVSGEALPRPPRSPARARDDESLMRALQKAATDEPPSSVPPAGPPPRPESATGGPHMRGLNMTAISGPLEGRSFAFVQKPLHLGRDAACDICMPDPLVAPQHARIRRQEGDIIIEDLDSAGGVSVNGQHVRRQPLRLGDVVRIGASEFFVHL